MNNHLLETNPLETTSRKLTTLFNQMQEDALREYLQETHGVSPKQPLTVDTIRYLQEDFSIHRYNSDNSVQFVRESDKTVIFKVGMAYSGEDEIKVYLEEYWRK